MLEGLQILVPSPVALQMTLQFMLDKFLQYSLKLRNEIFLPTLNEAIYREKTEEKSLRYVLFSLKKY